VGPRRHCRRQHGVLPARQRPARRQPSPTSPIALRRLGVPVTWVSRLDDDTFGDLIERELRAEGVTVLATRSSTDPTGLMAKERRPLGRSRVRYYRSTSAATRITPWLAMVFGVAGEGAVLAELDDGRRPRGWSSSSREDRGAKCPARGVWAGKPREL
jgi:hypothetical protein